MTTGKRHRETITFTNPIESIPIKIVSIGALASKDIGDGRLIPVLIIDTSSRPDIEDLIKAHRYVSPGDTKSVWGQEEKGAETVWLLIEFERPTTCKAILEFNIIKDANVIDQIVNSEALYLQSAKEGEKLSKTLDKEGIRILIEIPSHHFRTGWNEMLYNVLLNDGKEKGLSKKEAKEFASGVINKWRKFGGMRIKGQ